MTVGLPPFVWGSRPPSPKNSGIGAEKSKRRCFGEAVEHLFGAGFSSNQIGVYLLCGLPGQSPEEVAEAIAVVKETGALPYLAEYSPIPGTQMWPEAAQSSQFNISGEPLYHNNTFFACRRPDFSYQDLLHLKDLARQARHKNQ